jgi:DNA polymerase III alpha subunit (gram-positive type)
MFKCCHCQSINYVEDYDNEDGEDIRAIKCWKCQKTSFVSEISEILIEAGLYKSPDNCCVDGSEFPKNV